ncbi:hypothetical protein ROS217_11881 [Roseovarius sp. 217]|nr:hypothetical protein ROS217_11881 [Roseovarius sp. 217]
MLIDQAMPMVGRKIIDISWSKVSASEMPQGRHLSIRIIRKQGVVSTGAKQFDDNALVVGFHFPTPVRSPTDQLGPSRGCDIKAPAFQRPQQACLCLDCRTERHGVSPVAGKWVE